MIHLAEICSIPNASCVHFAVIYDQCYYKRFWDDCCSFFSKNSPWRFPEKTRLASPCFAQGMLFPRHPYSCHCGKREPKKRSDRHGSSLTPPDSGSGCVARARVGRRETPNEAQCLRRLAISDPGLPLSKADLLGCVLFPELQELHKRSFINLRLVIPRDDATYNWSPTLFSNVVKLRIVVRSQGLIGLIQVER